MRVGLFSCVCLRMCSGRSGSEHGRVLDEHGRVHGCFDGEGVLEVNPGVFYRTRPCF